MHVTSGKVWGNKSHPPVLCLHGILDNCNTFDRLLPLLPSCFFYICLDFAGHGLSSHLPPGFQDNALIFVKTVERAVRHLGLSKFIIMGHSYGGRTGVLYASMFPEKVTKLILLDTIGFGYVHLNETQGLFRRNIHLALNVEHALATKQRPKYTYEDLINRVIAGRSRQDSSFKREAAEIVLARHIEKVPNEDKYYYTPDQHCKFYDDFTPAFTLEQLKYLYTKHIKCKVLIIICSESYEKHNANNYRDLLSVWKTNPGTEIHYVEGNHDVHINEPQRINKFVETFLLDPKDLGRSKL
ncbi:hypothetical protein M8J75_001603 [Diaphorina citri]|nr:hypothetical protein M8J75_001603 [Diaphorina citri]